VRLEPGASSSLSLPAMAPRRRAPRLEHDAAPLAVAHGDVQPGAARRIGGRQLVPGQVPDADVACSGPPVHRRADDGDVAVSCWSCAIVARRRASSSCGSASTPSSARYRLSIRSMKKLPPRNACRATALARLAEHRRDRASASRPRHVARLAAPLGRGTRCGATPGRAPARAARRRPAVGPSACVMSVWQVAHISDSRCGAASAGTKPVAERIMRSRPASPRTARTSALVPRGRVDHEAAGEALTVAEALGPIWWHTVHDTPSAASRSRRRRSRADRQVREDPPCVAGGRRFRSAPSACGRSSTRPRSLACGRVVDRLARTAACQYGSRAELAIIDARQLTPIDTSSPPSVVSPLWQARQASAVWKRRRVNRRRDGPAPGRRAARSDRRSPATAARPAAKAIASHGLAVLTSHRTARRRTSPRGSRSPPRARPCAR
jgi:hypothetical protein